MRGRGSAGRRVRFSRGSIPIDIEPTWTAKLEFGHGSYVSPSKLRPAQATLSPEELRKRLKAEKMAKMRAKREQEFKESLKQKSNAEIGALLEEWFCERLGRASTAD